jgi:hypothetical protein
VLFEQDDEGTHDVRIELRSGSLAETRGRFLHRETAPVRPVGGHGVKGVADEDDARLELFAFAIASRFSALSAS